MSSDTNNINHETTFKPSEPTPCTNGCGFFGSAATNGLCSKCFRDIQVNEQQTASAKAAVNKFVNHVVSSPPQPCSSSSYSSGSEPVEPVQPVATVDVTEKARNRCLTCNKKVGVMGFTCKCGDMFCGSHRYPEKHECEYDFKRTGRDAIAKANPVVKADKVDRI